MPRSKNPRAYPMMYYDLTRAVAGGKKIVLNFPDKQAAKSERLNYYGFKNALEATHDELYNQAITIRIESRICLEESGGYDLIYTSSFDAEVNGKIVAALNAGVEPARIPSPNAPTLYPETPFTAKDAAILPAGAIGGYEEEDTNEQAVYKKYLQPFKPEDDKEKG